MKKSTQPMNKKIEAQVYKILYQVLGDAKNDLSVIALAAIIAMVIAHGIIVEKPRKLAMAIIGSMYIFLWDRYECIRYIVKNTADISNA